MRVAKMTSNHVLATGLVTAGYFKTGQIIREGIDVDTEVFESVLREGYADLIDDEKVVAPKEKKVVAPKRKKGAKS